VTRWTDDELDRIGAADELEIAAMRPDGTLRKPVTIWVVRDGDDLYVRSWRGSAGKWYRAALAAGDGHVSAAGVEKDVAFVTVADDAVNDTIDAAFRTKYGRYGDAYVGPMVNAQARATTLRLVPRAPAG
jgi:hypothetical protein